MDDNLPHELDFFVKDAELIAFFESAIDALSFELFRPFQNKFMLCLKSLNDLSDRLDSVKREKSTRSVLIQCHPRDPGVCGDHMLFSTAGQGTKRQYDDNCSMSLSMRKCNKKKIRRNRYVNEADSNLRCLRNKKFDEYSFSVIHNVNNIVNNGIVILNNSSFIQSKNNVPAALNVSSIGDTNLLNKLTVVSCGQSSTAIKDITEANSSKSFMTGVCPSSSNLFPIQKNSTTAPKSAACLLRSNQIQVLYAIPVPQPVLQINSNMNNRKLLIKPQCQKPSIAKSNLDQNCNILSNVYQAQFPNHMNSLGNSLSLLHPPELTCSVTDEEITLMWNMKGASDVNVNHYLIYFYEENQTASKNIEWKLLGRVNPLPLPIAVTLKQFSRNNRYHFTVLPVDNLSCNGVFSRPVSVSI